MPGITRYDRFFLWQPWRFPLAQTGPGVYKQTFILLSRMKKAATIFVLILLGSTFAFVVRQRELERANIRKETDALRASVENDSGLKERIAVLSRERDQLALKVKELEAGLPRPVDGSEKASSNPAVAEASKKKKVSRIKVDPALLQMLRDPSLRKLQEQTLSLVATRSADEIAVAIGLPADKKEAFLKLMVDEYHQRMMPEVDGEGYIVTDRRRNFTDEYRELLGPDYFRKFEDHKKAQLERHPVDAIQKVLARSGESLSPHQSEALVQIYREAKRVVEAAPRQTSQDRSFSGEMMATLRRQDEVQKYVLQRAHGVLTPAQLEVLESHYAAALEQQRRVLELTLKMMQEENTK